MQHFGVDSWQEVEHIFSDYNSDYHGHRDWLDVLIQAKDGYQISVHNAARDVTLQGTFQRNAETGHIEIMNYGVAAPEKAYALSGSVVSFTDANGDDPVWGAYHPSQYYRLPGPDDAVAADISQCQANMPWGCGNLLDDVSLGVGVVGAGVCAAVTAGGCLIVVGAVGTTAGGLSTGMTARNAWAGEATWWDVAVYGSTTVVGGFWGQNAGGFVGVGVSAIQRAYDWWVGTR